MQPLQQQQTTTTTTTTTTQSSIWSTNPLLMFYLAKQQQQQQQQHNNNIIQNPSLMFHHQQQQQQQSQQFEHHQQQQQQHDDDEPYMIVLMGLPGSGKSTLALALETIALPTTKFVRINQDTLKTRQQCELKLRSILQQQQQQQNNYTTTTSQSLCPIIDRCNFNYQQRSTWYTIVEEEYHRNNMRLQQQTQGNEDNPINNNNNNNPSMMPIDVIVLDLSPSICLQNCQQRPYHETLSKEKAPSVIRMIQKQWQLPTTNDEERRRIRSCTILKSTKDIQNWFDCKTLTTKTNQPTE